jgi:hypothetical protein
MRGTGPAGDPDDIVVFGVIVLAVFPQQGGKLFLQATQTFLGLVGGSFAGGGFVAAVMPPAASRRKRNSQRSLAGANDCGLFFSSAMQTVR